MKIVLFEGFQNAFQRTDEIDTEEKTNNPLHRKIIDLMNFTECDEMALRFSDDSYLIVKQKNETISDDVSYNDQTSGKKL